MAWTDPTQRSTGELITQSIYNTDIIDNLVYLIGAVEPDLTNRSGGAVEEGDVVIADPNNDNSFKTTTTASDEGVIGVVRESLANLETGRIAMAGIVVVKVQGNVTRGNFLVTSTTAGRAADGGTLRASATFARALTSYSGGGAGTVYALLLPGSGGAVPKNGVFYTTDSSVPAGYTEYTAARGRMIVGLPSGGTVAGTVGTALSNLENRTHTHVYTDVPQHRHAITVRANTPAGAPPAGSGNTGGPWTAYTEYEGVVSPSTQATNHMMPYIQLLAIKKS